MNSRKVRKLVQEFVCTTSFAQGLRKCIQFYEEYPEFKVVHQEWEETMDRLAEKHGEAYPL